MGGRQNPPRKQGKGKEYFVPVFFCFATPSSLCIEFAPPQQLQHAAFSNAKGVSFYVNAILLQSLPFPIKSMTPFCALALFFFLFLVYLIMRFRVKSLVIRRARRVLVASSRTSTRALGTRRARRELRRSGRVARARWRLLLAGAASKAWTRG